jgi:hypothetical protein
MVLEEDVNQLNDQSKSFLSDTEVNCSDQYQIP